MVNFMIYELLLYLHFFKCVCGGGAVGIQALPSSNLTEGVRARAA